MWDVICAIWDLLRCTEICKSAVIEFSAGTEISSADFSRFFCCPVFLLPKLLSRSLSWDLGSAFLPLVDWNERGAWFVGCSWHTVPSWSAANEVQDMLRLRAHRRLRGQCKECGGSSSCEHGRQRYYCNCKECGGSSFCEHRRQRSQCKECGRSSFCEHGRPRDYCNCRVRWWQHLRARAAVHHLHEGVQWQCHSQAQAAAWPLLAQAAA